MNEFSHTIKAEDVTGATEKISFGANEEERRALAERYGIISIRSLNADLEVRREQGVVIAVRGYLDAYVTQECVVTLEPFEDHITEEVEGFFTDRDDTISFAKLKHKHIQENQDPETSFLDEKDDPEPVINGSIDVGELIAQFLSLALPAHPHKDGVSFENTDENAVNQITEEQIEKHNPFAVLETLKNQDK